MELVVDVNVVISAIVSMNGKTRDLIFFDGMTLFAPEYLLMEFEKYKQEIIRKSKLSEENFELAFLLIFSKIKLIPFSEFEASLNKAKDVCPDPNDVEYFALALSKNIPIWSDDKALKKQSLVKVFSTSELIRKLRL
jgi:predicted nucleic acid-binding protein